MKLTMIKAWQRPSSDYNHPKQPRAAPSVWKIKR
ncbi:hypothetical protein HZ326_31606, partial [Fusarium oxysporum f. sp. albedinis]